ncbi:MAG TPA: Do family serine endopeptidase [Prolixibacteraceae bacterium]|nr:Do family serine endopeptidase [Prolixibacteraceae bacterium]
MKNLKKGLFTLLVALIGGFIALWAYTRYFDSPKILTVQQEQSMRYASLPTSGVGDLPDLTVVAENSVHAVVHIKVTQKGGSYSSSNFFDYFFGDGGPRSQQAPVRQGVGSGVIISPDGYIVTNNHVVDEADEISVVLNDKREFKAKLIGTDPSTDIALIKIDASGLPILKFSNSDNLKLGEWVLAVGNPFNLTSTVTAGIVSAKSRDIGINPDQMRIESFIQTDAAVNPGNSGGALVNTRGELVGINTAIASQTGSYSGLSFAIPSNIAQKVVADLREYGDVQRALLNVNIGDVNAEVAKKYNLDKIEGVFVGKVISGGAADVAGIKENDVIISVDNVLVNSTSELQEQIGKHRPGDKVVVEIKRENKKKQFNVTLRNKHGDTNIVKGSDDSGDVFGAKFAEISNRDKEELGIRYGVKITDLSGGKFKDAGIKKGFIITQVNKNAVSDVEELKRIIKNSRGGILVEGIYPNGEVAYYVFGNDGR